VARDDTDKVFPDLANDYPTSLLRLDIDGEIISVNEYGAAQLGYTIDELIGTQYITLSESQYQKQTQDRIQQFESNNQIQKWEQKQVKADGSSIWVSQTARLVNEASQYILIVSEDITESRKLSEELSYRATHDSVTGLINRDEFENRVVNMLGSTKQDGAQHVLCYLDLDQFKIVNDTCGHVAGDELLSQLGHLLLSQIRQRDTIARLGGDEFGLLMEHCPLTRAQNVAEKILETISDFTFIWEDRSFKIAGSIGIVSINSLSGNIKDILKQADTACYMAKNKGSNKLHVFESDDRGIKKKSIAALSNPTSNTQHYEVLVRMLTESNDLIAPDAFMPIAEHYNLSPDIDKWVINNLFNLFDNLSEDKKQNVIFSVNLSGHSLGNKELLKFILDSFNNNNIEPQNICFEITETVAIANLSNAIGFINTLRDKGCYFALDDFGSGLSSFAYLKNLNIDFIKIDGLFVKDIIDDSTSHAIVKSMHEVARSMNKRTIAEYVENKFILEHIRAIGIDYAQGSYISEILSFHDICDTSTAKILPFNKKQL
jgi:diguanylate cyclase (GGDEF)-like protein/PAS domain S-box-containing protein